MFALEFLIVTDPDENFIKTNPSVYINMLVRHFCLLKFYSTSLQRSMKRFLIKLTFLIYDFYKDLRILFNE